MKIFLYKLILFCALAGSLAAMAATTSAPVANVSHLGPTITAYVQRGNARLPIFLVDHLRKGDKLSVTTDKSENAEIKWLLVLATVSPATNKVEAQKFDLAEAVDEASIDITADDQVPIIVLAPQVKTMFGLRTSFSESSALIIDAVKSDPQRFVDLQKIDQINHAIALLSAMLNAVIQSQKPDQAVAAVKTLAAKFGVKYVDPACFKDNSVNTKCVADDIVSSENLAVPSDDIWSAAGPNSSAAKVPTDIFASLKIVTEAGTYLANKYGDNYDFAPSSGQRKGSANNIQLFTNTRFKSGDVKVAYVYVPSWYLWKQPEVVIADKVPACLAKGELAASVKGLLPLTNYWHDWHLVIHTRGSATVVAQIDGLEFKPDSGLFSFDFKKSGKDLPMNGQLLDATLTGKFGFAEVNIAPFKVALPTSENSLDHISGLESLVSGEHAKLRFAGADGSACVDQLEMVANGKTLATGTADLRGELNIDLSKTDPGPATLEIQQYGVEKQELPITIMKRRAHIQRLMHFDLETEITAYGDNLDCIELIQAGHVACRATSDSSAQATSGTRVFSCPVEVSRNSDFPAQVTVKHQDLEPASFDFPVTKVGARPHMAIDVAGAIVTNLSAKAMQWGLGADDQLVTEDSGLGILMHAFGGYKLSRGPYMLQIKFADDPQTEQTPISAPLMSDLSHNELRTRHPISFANVQLPSILNPIWYRVQHLPSGLVGDWQALNRSVVYFPQLDSLSCGVSGNVLLIHGSQLELVDWASNDFTRTSAAQQSDASTRAALTRCDKGLCLGINALGSGNKLRIKVHWIDDRLFDVTFPDVPNCGAIE